MQEPPDKNSGWKMNSRGGISGEAAPDILSSRQAIAERAISATGWAEVTTRGPYGSIQVPGGTEPIVLHRDAVSGGGYFMIGTVISADMDLIGQLQPHTEARFVAVDMPTALKARSDRAALLDRVRRSLS